MKKKESEAIGIEENYLKQFEEESLDEIIDKYSLWRTTEKSELFSFELFLEPISLALIGIRPFLKEIKGEMAGILLRVSYLK